MSVPLLYVPPLFVPFCLYQYTPPLPFWWLHKYPFSPLFKKYKNPPSSLQGLSAMPFPGDLQNNLAALGISLRNPYLDFAILPL